MLVLKFLLAMLPIIWLLIALSGLKMPGFKACAIAAVIAAVLAPVFWKQPVAWTGAAALEGALNALWPICLVILAALFTYNLTLETKAMEDIKYMLSGVSMDGRVLILIIGWAFGNFMEGMAGFGTAVAIPAAILVALGFDPVRTIVACLVVNSMPTAFGSVGVPTVTLSAVTGIDANILSANVATIECVLFILSPFVMVAIFGGGLKALKGVFGITTIAALSFVIPELIAGLFMGPQLPDIIGSVCSLICTVLVATKTKNKLVPDEYVVSAGGREKRTLTAKQAVVAWSPFILILVFLLITTLVPFIHDPLAAVKTSVQIYPEEGASKLSFSWLNTPGVIIFIAAFIGGVIQKASGSAMLRVLGKTLKSNWKTVFTICCVVACAKIMDHSGMTTDISNLLARTGSFFPFVSPLIGVLGAFITGSGTSTCVLFGSMQAMTAQQIGASPAWLAAANVMGAGIGKMISPQCIAIGLAAVNMVGEENVILKHVTKYCVIYFVIGGILCFCLPHILPI
ncbi:MAG: lactate permease LctP family transporter [Eubacterium sp.]|nr:lactate permease LctP family transporter [Eubacterium sp.]